MTKLKNKKHEKSFNIAFRVVLVHSVLLFVLGGFSIQKYVAESNIINLIGGILLIVGGLVFLTLRDKTFSSKEDLFSVITKVETIFLFTIIMFVLNFFLNNILLMIQEVILIVSLIILKKQIGIKDLFIINIAKKLSIIKS